MGVESDMDVESIIIEWAYAHRKLSLTDLYREQDRIIRVIQRLEIQVAKPRRMIYMLERKLEALECLIEQRYGNLSLVT